MSTPLRKEPDYSTIYEVVYPDDRRRASGEPPDEAVSRAFFALKSDAERFASHNRGVVSPKPVTREERARLHARHMLG